MLVTGDFNGDGYEDLAISGRWGFMVWLENPATAKLKVVGKST
jgi:hypothetical protein